MSIATREALLARLAEAAEVEHCLMCVYLYAAFSLKDGEAEGLSRDEAAAVARWRGEILTVAREEMAHLLLVSNLLTALGGAAHFGRMNFPLPAGFLPADMQVRLAPFDRDTIQHLVWLERPAGSTEPMGAGFTPVQHYARGGPQSAHLMPHAADYATVGVLYEMVLADLDELCARLGEANVFIGDPEGQIDARLVSLPGVTRVICLKTAHAAIEGIVAQGEGATDADETSHFQRFCRIRTEYDALLSANPAFKPAHPVAHNPVMRRPPTPEGRVWIEAPEAAAAVDLANALYLHMLRLLAQAFGRTGPARDVLIDAAIGTMFAITPAAEACARLPARPGEGGCNAGMTFAMSRALSALPQGAPEWRMLGERFDEIAAHAARIAGPSLRLQRCAAAIGETAAAFRKAADVFV